MITTSALVLVWAAGIKQHSSYEPRDFLTNYRFAAAPAAVLHVSSFDV